jgi:hypothetical protein
MKKNQLELSVSRECEDTTLSIKYPTLGEEKKLPT